ncbi:MAG: hypothetical protein WBG08_04395 [Litorimonas sp.]
MEETSAIDDWAELCRLARAKLSRRMRGWSFGTSPRLGRNRVARMLADPGMKAVQAALDRTSDARLKTLRAYAVVNQEQAAAALRMTAIANVSVPVVLVTVVTQVTDGRIWTDLFALYSQEPDAVLVMGSAVLLSVLGVLLIMAIGATRLGEARDLRHLIDLNAADRGIHFGLEDDPLQSP